jgi:hypothetical protein
VPAPVCAEYVPECGTYSALKLHSPPQTAPASGPGVGQFAVAVAVLSR